MTAFALKPQRRVTAEMNVTPLVDVMLVLLVIFMLAAPLKTQRLPLFNASSCAADCPPPPTPARLSIKRTGELYWNGTSVSRSVLQADLIDLARDAGAALEIHAEPTIRYDQLTEALAAARNAQVQRINVMARRD